MSAVKIAVAAFFISACGISAQSFEVATIKPADPDAKGRYIKMQDAHRLVAKNYTLLLLISRAYNLRPEAIFGGPPWTDSDHYDILAITPGDAKPGRDEQMAMLRVLLTERFHLTFHREPKEFPIYALKVGKSGPKLNPAAAPDGIPDLISTVYPQRILMPARSATMNDFAFTLQALLDRAVVDQTGLSGRYDFDLAWAPDETQFGGEMPPAPADAPDPPLFTAIQQQLGLKLEPTRGQVQTLAIDTVDRPSPN